MVSYQIHTSPNQTVDVINKSQQRVIIGVLTNINAPELNKTRYEYKFQNPEIIIKKEFHYSK